MTAMLLSIGISEPQSTPHHYVPQLQRMFGTVLRDLEFSSLLSFFSPGKMDCPCQHRWHVLDNKTKLQTNKKQTNLN